MASIATGLVLLVDLGALVVVLRRILRGRRNQILHALGLGMAIVVGPVLLVIGAFGQRVVRHAGAGTWTTMAAGVGLVVVGMLLRWMTDLVDARR